MAGLKLVCIAVVCMVLTSAAVDAVIPCNQVIGYLSPCIGFARGRVGMVPSPCCVGVRNLNSAAGTTPDRRAVCQCMKSFATRIPDLDFGRIASIPGKCGVSIPYELSPRTDCNSVK